jgi:hypothetical protein
MPGRSALAGASAVLALAIAVVACTAAPADEPAAAAGRVSPPPPGAPPWPTRAGPDHHHLVDQYGRPYLIIGDSPQDLAVALSEQQADAYFADRQAHGFDALWVNLIANGAGGGRPDGATFDGILPFSTPADLSTPNEPYFQRIDDLLSAAQRHGLTIFLDPVETAGHLVAPGLIPNLLDNGPTADFEYGAYLGRRYRDHPNLVWLHGNDFQTWRDPADDAAAQAVARGIRSTDPGHLQTVELDYYVSSSLDDPAWAPLIDLDATYSYAPTYAKVLDEYDRAALPTFLIEALYEFEHDATPAVLRRQEYWTMLSGATGQFYGNGYTWPFAEGWPEHLDSPGATQFATVLRAAFADRPWWQLVPDRLHRLLVSGYGGYDATADPDYASVAHNDYATAALTPDGSLGMIYTPTARPLTVDLRVLSGPAGARWYDPVTGRYTPAAAVPVPGAPSGTVLFTPAAANDGGDGDWLLVLQK